MLDSGADVSLITSQLANSLRAKRIRCPTRVIGINNDSDAGHLVEATLTSLLGMTRESVTIQALVVDKLPDVPWTKLSEVSNRPFLQGKLLLADWSKENRVDVLVGSRDIPVCYHGMKAERSADKKLIARSTIFGWTVLGGAPAEEPSTPAIRVAMADSRPDVIIERFWKTEDVPTPASPYTAEEATAIDHFKETITRDLDGRYVVQLPRKSPVPVQGESRSLAVKRFQSNKHSLEKNGTWPQLEAAV